MRTNPRVHWQMEFELVYNLEEQIFVKKSVPLAAMYVLSSKRQMQLYTCPSPCCISESHQ